MDDSRRLVAAFLKFLESELQSSRHGSDAAESIEVAFQCLQQAYNLEDSGISPGDKPLLEIFTTASQPELPEATEEAKESAEIYREQGNTFMKVERFDMAVESYTKAIEYDPANAVFYCNRAAGHTKMGNHQAAIADCEKAIKINPLYSKAYGRLGFVYLSLGNHAKAARYYEKALQLEPDNANYRNNLTIATEKSNLGPQGTTEKAPPPGGMPNLGGVDLGALLSNPAVMNMAQNFMTNPQMQSMMANMMGGMMGQGGDQSSTPSSTSTGNTGTPSAGAGQAPSGQPGAASNFNLADVFSATQQFAEQMQRTNPELVSQLKSQFQQGQPRGPDNDPPAN